MFTMLDIRKAYPNTPRNGCWRVLENEGVPSHVVTLMRHIHGDTHYRCRNAMGSSEPYQLHRGLREGCPSSCIAYLYFHNAVLRDYNQRLEAVEPGAGIAIRTSPAAPLGGMQANEFRKIKNEWERVLGRLVCFADDTTLLERSSGMRRRKTMITQALADWRECVHPDKWQHLRARHTSEPALTELPMPRLRRTTKQPELGGLELKEHDALSCDSRGCLQSERTNGIRVSAGQGLPRTSRARVTTHV